MSEQAGIDLERLRFWYEGDKIFEPQFVDVFAINPKKGTVSFSGVVREELRQPRTHKDGGFIDISRKERDTRNNVPLERFKITLDAEE